MNIFCIIFVVLTICSSGRTADLTDDQVKEIVAAIGKTACNNNAQDDQFKAFKDCYIKANTLSADNTYDMCKDNLQPELKNSTEKDLLRVICRNVGTSTQDKMVRCIQKAREEANKEYNSQQIFKMTVDSFNACPLKN